MIRLRKIKLAQDKLEKELEVMDFVNMTRLTSFVFKVFLQRRQRVSVNYFKRYTINKEDVVDDAHKDKALENEKRAISQERLINECIPEDSQIDRRIVYELTGIMLEPHEFLDESSLEDELDDSDRGG